MVPESALDERPSAQRLSEIRAALRERSASFVATAEFLAGSAELLDPVTNSWRALESGQLLARGMKISVKSGRALIRFHDGSDVWLAEGSELDLSEWKENARRLRLAAGRMLALVAPQKTKPFVVGTPHGDARALGTAFETRTDADALSLAVLHGRVRLTSESGTAEVRSGTRAQVIPGMPISVQRIAATPSSFQWLEDISSSKENAAVAAAYKAVAKTILNPKAGETEKSSMKTGLKVIGVLMLLAGIGAAVYTTAGDTKSNASDTSRDSLTGTRGPIGSQQMAVKIKAADGEDVEYVANTPEEIQALREKMEKEGHVPAPGKAKTLTGGIPQIEFNAPGVTDAQREALNRDIKSAMQAYNELIAKGVSPEEAQRIVNGALNDSLSKQLEQSGNGVSFEGQIGGKGENRTVDIRVRGNTP